MACLIYFTGGALNKLSIFSLGIGAIHYCINYHAAFNSGCSKIGRIAEEWRVNKGVNSYSSIRVSETIVLGIVQSITLVKVLSSIHNPDVVLTAGPLFVINTIIVLTASAVFVMWMGEQITERGVGNGASLLIFIGIASRLPVMVHNTYEAVQTGQTPMWGVALMVVVFLGLGCFDSGFARRDA